MHDTQVSNVNLGGACVSTSPNGWDMRNHIKEKAELALAFVDAAIDESNLYRRINKHMYHMVGPVRDEALVVKTIHSQNGIPALVSRWAQSICHREYCIGRLHSSCFVCFFDTLDWEGFPDP